MELWEINYTRITSSGVNDFFIMDIIEDFQHQEYRNFIKLF